MWHHVGLISDSDFPPIWTVMHTYLLVGIKSQPHCHKLTAYLIGPLCILTYCWAASLKPTATQKSHRDETPGHASRLARKLLVCFGIPTLTGRSQASGILPHRSRIAAKLRGIVPRLARKLLASFRDVHGSQFRPLRACWKSSSGSTAKRRRTNDEKAKRTGHAPGP